MSTVIRVSVGIITRGSQLLICQRRVTDLHPSQWEFPGGKAQDSESDEVCLQRELREELHINATIGEVLERTTHSYPNGRTVALTFLHVPTYTGEIVNTQFQELVWVKPEELSGYNFLEGDRQFIAELMRGRWSYIFHDRQSATGNPQPS